VEWNTENDSINDKSTEWLPASTQSSKNRKQQQQQPQQQLLLAALGIAAALATAGSITTTTNQAYASPLDEVLDGEGGLVISAYGRDSN
jgi:hypothetical protein